MHRIQPAWLTRLKRSVKRNAAALICTPAFLGLGTNLALTARPTLLHQATVAEAHQTGKAAVLGGLGTSSLLSLLLLVRKSKLTNPKQ